MPYHVRPMCREDIVPVAEIDREAFPTIWPAVNYEHELKNRLAHYIVACDDDRIVEPVEVQTAQRKGLSAVIAWWRRLFGGNPYPSYGLPLSGGPYIIGFAGLWIMVDEAHIINIAVRESYRRKGLGELLLISSIDMALELKARIVTLEVRASNTSAQALYRKYGMTEVGLRRGYYVDDKEDAVLMSTDDIGSASFQSRFQELKQAHYVKLGMPQSPVAE